ncbi:hypothetical protein L209DRAFT_249734 [Thermothelomyces heterothallicus CBS 203.75]
MARTACSPTDGEVGTCRAQPANSTSGGHAGSNWPYTKARDGLGESGARAQGSKAARQLTDVRRLSHHSLSRVNKYLVASFRLLIRPRPRATAPADCRSSRPTFFRRAFEEGTSPLAPQPQANPENTPATFLAARDP